MWPSLGHDDRTPTGASRDAAQEPEPASVSEPGRGGTENQRLIEILESIERGRRSLPRIAALASWSMPT
jgi:hypothetical protein